MRLVAATRSAPRYKLYALPGGPPHRFGMVRADGGRAIELADGSKVQGFVCEAHAVAGATDITAHGGWLASKGS